MQVHLPEKLKSAFVDHVDLVVNLLIVCDLAIDYASIVDDSAVVDFRLVDVRMGQVPVQVVKLV